MMFCGISWATVRVTHLQQQLLLDLEAVPVVAAEEVQRTTSEELGVHAQLDAKRHVRQCESVRKALADQDTREVDVDVDGRERRRPASDARQDAIGRRVVRISRRDVGVEEVESARSERLVRRRYAAPVVPT